jgi:hypothetical protein
MDYCFDDFIERIRSLPIVKEVTTKNDKEELIRMYRCSIKLHNGYSISLIRGRYSYGGDEGLFEIMPSDECIFDEGETEDSVLGYLTKDRVLYYIEKAGSFDQKEKA